MSDDGFVKTDEVRCLTCAYLEFTDKPVGQCRRHTPLAGSALGAWPNVEKASGWCGEWVRRRDEA